MDSLEFCKSVTADMIMSRLHLDVMYNGGGVDDEVFHPWMKEFNLTKETEVMLGMINNYLYVNSPLRDPYLGLLVSALGDTPVNEPIIQEQWGGLTHDELHVRVQGQAVANELTKVVGLIQGIRAAYLTHFFEVVEEQDERVTRKQNRGETVVFSANGSSPSLVYMKSLYEQLKGYWAVALRPVDKDRLDKSYYLESESWNFQIGRFFTEEFVDGPFGKIVFSEPEVIPFKIH